MGLQYSSQEFINTFHALPNDWRSATLKATD